MGRKTFEITGASADADSKTVIVSSTLQSKDCPGVIIINDNLETAIAELRSEPGKDIWLFGGGTLFTSLLDLGLVDVVEVAIIPILLGDGVPLLQPLQDSVNLSFTGSRIYEKTGTVTLEYKIKKEAHK
jgi:dihydrofolate reductase